MPRQNSCHIKASTAISWRCARPPRTLFTIWKCAVGVPKFGSARETGKEQLFGGQVPPATAAPRSLARTASSRGETALRRDMTRTARPSFYPKPKSRRMAISSAGPNRRRADVVLRFAAACRARDTRTDGRARATACLTTAWWMLPNCEAVRHEWFSL